MTKTSPAAATATAMTPLPRMQMFSIIMVQFCEAINVNILFPFLAFMIEDLGYGGHRLGYYAGGLAAAFCGAQFCSSVLWGLFSDRYGRKLAIVVGTLGTSVGMLVFGTASTYAQAVAGRALGGFLCGNVGIMKCFITEITDDSNRGKAFAWLSVSWATGVLVAPLLGGLLCNPADKYPAHFDADGVFARLPYLLPCLFAFATNIFTGVCCMIFMKESRRALNNNNKSDGSASSSASTESLSSSSGSDKRKKSSPHSKSTRSKAASSVEMTSVSVSRSLREKISSQFMSSSQGTQRSQYAALRENDDDDLDSEHDDIEAKRSLGKQPNDVEDDKARLFVIDNDAEEDEENGVESPFADESSHAMLFSAQRSEREKDRKREQKKKPHTHHAHHAHHTHIPEVALEDAAIQDSLFAITEDLDRETDDSSASSADEGYEEEHTHSDTESVGEAEAEGEEDCFAVLRCESSPARLPNDSAQSVLRQRIVILSVSNYGMLAMAYILLDETIPLFLKLSREEGGLEFSSTQIGLLLSLSGLAMLFFSSFVMPIIASKSKKWLFEMGAIGATVCVFLWPLLAVLNHRFLIHIQNHHVYVLTLWPLLLLTSVLKNVFGSCAFTAVMIQVNHSVLEDFLGAVNGLGQSLAALARAFGPAVGGLLWSISIQRKFVFLNFIGVAVSLVACVYINRQLPDSIDFKKVHKRDKQQHSKDAEAPPTVEMMH